MTQALMGRRPAADMHIPIALMPCDPLGSLTKWPHTCCLSILHYVQGSSLFILGWNVGLFQALFADVAARWALEMVEGRLRVTKEQVRVSL